MPQSHWLIFKIDNYESACWHEVSLSNKISMKWLSGAFTWYILFVYFFENYRRIVYKVAQKLGTPFLYSLTLPNINRFSKLFHCQNQEKICNNTITNDLTTPQVCRYTTLWNVEYLSQRFTDRAIGQLRHQLKCGVQEQGGHIERTFDVKLQMW